MRWARLSQFEQSKNKHEDPHTTKAKPTTRGVRSSGSIGVPEVVIYSSTKRQFHIAEYVLN